MLKKILIGSALVVGTGAVIGGTSAISYVKTGYSSVRDSIKEHIPIEVEIKRVREMIKDLKPEIADNVKLIAREEVEVAKLSKEVSTKNASLDKSKTAILQLKDDLQSGKRFVSYGGKTFDMDQVKKDLNDRFKHFQTQEATAVKLEKILAAREQNQVAEASSQYAINDSSLSRVRETIDEIATRIEVAEKTLDQQDLITGEIPVLSDETPVDLLEQITVYFGAPAETTLTDNR